MIKLNGDKADYKNFPFLQNMLFISFFNISKTIISFHD